MNAGALLFAIVFALAAGAVIWMFEGWLTKIWARRLVAHIVAQTHPSRPGRTALRPEGDFVVEVSEAGATARRPDGKVESVEWNALQKVAVLTTDDGPFAPDAFWVLIGSQGGCVVPWGATGEKELLNRLQTLSGFRNDVLVNAASLTANQILTCWERTDLESGQPPISPMGTD
jgi:hypothetical protein